MSDFYLICFLVGFSLSVIGALTGAAHLHIHVPHLHFGHGVHLGGGHAAGGHGGGASVLNFGTMVAFVMWFGAGGYLLTRFSTLWFLLALGAALLCGLAGAACIFLFLTKIASREGEALNPADYEMVGVLGTVTSPIRRGGTGEAVYSQGGARRSAAVRSEDGTAIPKGTEVIVTRYDKGIAYVRRWDELTNS